jgi:tetratricopeptide (TPR) repeat protein
MTWKQLQQCVRDKNADFGQLLAQNFLLLHQHAKDKKDTTSVMTLKVIIAGLVDLTNAIAERKTEEAFVPTFSAAAYTVFSRLGESYNNPAVLKQAGLHYLMEWRLPEAALRYFQRALSLGAVENSIHSLIEVATISVERKNNARKKTSAETGITASPGANTNVTRIIRETDKLLITKTQRPSPRAALVMTRFLKIKATAEIPATAKDCLKEATRAMDEGNLDHAHELLLGARRHPVKKEILCGLWSNLGKACHQAGKYPEMEAAYVQAYVYDPKGANTYYNLALAKSLNQKIAEAETLYRMAEKLDPTNPRIWCNLGVLYFQNDRFEEAEQAFRSAIHCRPDYARAWDNLASVLTAQEKPEEAIEACQKAIQIRPGYPEAYFKLSAIYFGKGDPASLTEAAAALSYVVNYPPLAASADALLSMIHSRLEKIDSAKASLQRAVESDPKCTLLPTVWTELEKAIRAT